MNVKRGRKGKEIRMRYCKEERNMFFFDKINSQENKEKSKSTTTSEDHSVTMG